jgi:dihydroorotase
MKVALVPCSVLTVFRQFQKKSCLPRDYACQYLDVPVHIAHISTKGSVDIIRRAKEEDVDVTCEVTPHHLILTENEFEKRPYDQNLKMNPPLRTEQDRQALLEALADGTIDVIATDHAPHAVHEKDDAFPNVPFGVTGLETAVSVILDGLVNPGIISPMRMAELMCMNPRMILDLPGGFIEEGAPADITLVAQKRWTVSTDRMHSLSINSPYIEREYVGKPVLTIVNGNIAYSEMDK